jgi:type II secretory pathway predicted ATPase ExeA
MYQSYWGLEDSPFRARSDRRFFFQSPTHEEAMARLNFLVDERRRAGLLLGGLGSGKSTVLQMFADALRRRGSPVAKVNLNGLEPCELLWLLATGFQMNPDPSLPSHTLWQLVTDRLTEYRYQELDTVVLLDDADEGSDALLAQIVRLVQLECRPESRLAVILAARSGRVGRLDSTLLELADLRIDLDPWDETETVRFLNATLAEAGRQQPVFEESAITRLHELSEGIPRRISQLADLALLAGAGQSLDQIDVATVEGVYYELGVVQT